MNRPLNRGRDWNSVEFKPLNQHAVFLYVRHIGDKRFAMDLVYMAQSGSQVRSDAGQVGKEEDHHAIRFRRLAELAYTDHKIVIDCTPG
jgi:hypothetical protein